MENDIAGRTDADWTEGDGNTATHKIDPKQKNHTTLQIKYELDMGSSRSKTIGNREHEIIENFIENK